MHNALPVKSFVDQNEKNKNYDIYTFINRHCLR